MKLSTPKKIAVLLGTLALACAPAYATVVNFDDIRSDGKLASVYRGIQWDDGWYALTSAFPPFDAHSSPTRVYADSDEKGFTFLDGDQLFDGAWFAGYFYVWFNLYNDGLLVHTSSTLEMFGSGPAQFLASGYADLVDRVEIVGIAGAYVMDDVSFHGEVPEPGVPALMLAGMLAAGALNVRMGRAEKRARVRAG